MSTHTVRDWRWDVGEVVHGEDTEKTDLKTKTAKQSSGDSCAVTGSQYPRVRGGVNRVNRTGERRADLGRPPLGCPSAPQPPHQTL